VIDTEKLQKAAMVNKAKTEHIIEYMKRLRIAITIDGGSFLISHDGGEYELIEKDPKQIGFVIEED